MRRLASVLAVVFSLSIISVSAQLESEHDVFATIDESLFVVGHSIDADPFAEAIKYYTTPVDVRRRGLDWWVARDLTERFITIPNEFVEPLKGGRVRLSGASRRYQIGALAEYGGVLKSGWALSGEVDFRSGRDVNIYGVFSNDLRSELTISRKFTDKHNLKIAVEVPILERGLQSSATLESFALRGDNLYNPTWGFYGDKVRNSRVSNYQVADISAIYNMQLWRDGSLSIDLGGEFGRRSVSRLGWYDAYNPTPDYYRKMPSYLAEGELKRDVEEVWRKGDERYTQIAWNDIVARNELSQGGVARYLVEDQVVNVAELDLTALVTQKFTDHFSLQYGAAIEVSNNRIYKELDDLLGADYHLDIDQYIGDYATLGNDMQNDLRNPNRRVGEGDRFGYDYSRRLTNCEALFGLNYRVRDISVALNGRFGGAKLWRVGHYEKERFAGDDSFGDSDIVDSSTSSLDFMCGYDLTPRSHLSLRGAMCRLPQDHQDLFVEEQSANKLVDDRGAQRFSFATLAYAYRSANLRFSVEGYFQQLSNRTDVWSGYDDLSYRYTDIVVSGISQRSMGVEAVCDLRVSRRLGLNCALSLGDFTYNSAPLVTLYDNVDMELLSEAQSVATQGCKVGNAPQYLLVAGADLMVDYGFNLSLDCSYAAGRYVAPSFVRRSERVLRGASSKELVAEIVEQQSLGSVFDLAISAMRSFSLRSNRYVTLYLRVENLLGDRDRIDYARESSRILRGSTFSTTGAYYAQPSEFVYTTPRTFYLSCSFSF